jgi:hypothetical protein
MRPTQATTGQGIVVGSIALVAALLIVPLRLNLLAISVEASVPYFHLYTGFRFIAIGVAPLVAVGAILLIRQSVPEPPGPLRRAAAIAIVTTVATPPVVALLLGVRALLPGAIAAGGRRGGWVALLESGRAHTPAPTPHGGSMVAVAACTGCVIDLGL